MPLKGMKTINGVGGTHIASNGVIRNPRHLGAADGSNNVTNGMPHNSTCPPQACPIAIVGMAMRLPGNITTADAFWDLLVQKKSTECLVPQSRYSLPGFFSSSHKSGTVRMEKGYFLADTNLQHLDTSFFSMSRAEVDLLDPQQRQLLEVTRECFENAGETGWRGKEVGCYIGVFGEDWQDLHAKDVQESGMYRIAGLGDFVLGNRISYEYDLRGPSMTIKTGCSSSLICLHMACQAIQNGECTSAIAGGTNLIMTPTTTIAMDDQQILSPTGSCKSFDAAADGYARGEAINAVYLKRLDDAIRDGDPIRAVIRGTSTNCDGKTPGIAHPSSDSHEALIRRTYKVAGLGDFAETAFVECHGTGTPVGDPLEAQAVANVFGESGVYVGSAILDSAASFISKQKGSSSPASSRRSHLLVFSANVPDSLRRLIDNYRGYVERNRSSLIDLAYTLSMRREHLPHRAFCVTHGGLPLEVSAPSKANSTTPEIVFVCTGQGAQWAQMGAKLMEEFPTFEADIRAMDRALAKLPYPPSWTIEDELLKPKKSSHVHLAEFSQPLCTAIQVALINILRTWRITPTAVVGHSSGEIAAGYACNAITAEEAITISYYRGEATKSNKQVGGMAAVGLGREGVAPYLANGVVVACENSPSNVTLSGDSDVLDSVAARLKEELPEVFVRRLHVNMAYHSHHMQAVGECYQYLMGNYATHSTTTIPFYSSVTGEKIELGSQFGNDYWRQNLESPVLFYPAVEAILDDPSKSNISKLFIEIGPHSALAGPLRQIFGSAKTATNAQYLATMIRDADCTESLLKTAGQLYLLGIPLHFPAVNPSGNVLTDLPTYPWHHKEQYWSESRIVRGWRTRKFPPHETLGSRVIEGNDLEPTWRNMFRLDDAPWIRDHVILGNIIFPGVGYVAMVGEAIRQLTGSSDYTVRRVVISTALVLHESAPTEMMTSLRKERLTDSLDSSWYEFTVMSYNGTSWMKHCVGQTRAGPVYANADTKKPDLEALPRHVSSARWYKALKKVGISYGATFAGMTNISAGINEDIAVATIVKGPQVSEPLSGLHPVVMDMCLQLYGVAACKGFPRYVEQLCVPAYFDEIYVRPASSAIRVQVSTSSTERGTVCGDAMGVADGEVVFRIRGLKLPPLEGFEKDPDPHACHELEWRPDIDFLNPQLKSLIAPCEDVSGPYSLCEKLTILCILEIAHQIPSIGNSKFLEKYRRWVESQVARARCGHYRLVPDAQEFASLSSQARKALIEATLEDILPTDAEPLGRAIVRIFEYTKSIFEGETEPLDILLQDNLLAEIYSFGDRWDYKTFMHLVSHHKPNLHVLEIGAGTGGTTESVLRDLVLPDGRRMYASYTYTDISAGFFVAAKERFKNVQNMKYAVLDITKDPVEQGFKAGAYDLVLASNVIHSTPSIREALVNTRRLLSPGGRLLLQELCTDTKCINYVMGLFPGWWLGFGDNRINEPYISPKRWDRELRAAGFRGADVVVHDHEGDFKVNAIIVATPAVETPNRRVTLLHGSSDETVSPIVSRVEAFLRSQDYEVNLCTLQHNPPPSQDILSLLDLESAPFFASITAPTFHTFTNFITHLPSSSGVLWVTRSSQLKCQNPDYALILGLARTIRCELLLDFGTLEIDTTDSPGVWEMVVKVLAKFQSRIRDGDLDPDWEYALSEGVVHVPRFRPISVSQELAKSSLGGPVKKLTIGKRGLLQTLQWVGRPLAAVLTGDDIEIEMRAVAMNFKDVLISMGIIEGRVIEGKGLGCEGAGVVRRVGPNIKHLKPGDRVIYFGMGAFATIVMWDRSSGLLVKIPEEMSDVDAATLPAVYGTVVHSLLDVARMEKGQTVLIHSACGGVGLAAIEVCRMVGSVIYATVGSEEKVQYLITTYGIPRSHIFNSHDTSFLPAVMAATNNRGVDIVLNSLTGELFQASWQCVAEFGKMIEIGKRDFIGKGKLDIDLFERNRSFYGVDFAAIYHHNPELNARVLDKAMDLLTKGLIKPIRAKTVFPASQIQDAFRFMQKGQHIGKIVVTMPENPETDLPVTPDVPQLVLRPDASYLLVGGLGGIGRSVAVWMATHGATNLIFLSRSAGKKGSDQVLFRELQEMGCSVQVFAGSVCSKYDVENVVSMAAKPIVGVVQMSMVLQDRALPEMTHENFLAAVEPKVQGTWTLHNALSASPLSFFIVFSSTSGMAGWTGQANYAAANTFLDAFVQYRHSLGLPASVLVVGTVEDVGYVSEKPAVLEMFRARAIYTLSEQDLLESLHLAIARSRPYDHPPAATTGLGGNYVNPSQLAIGVRSTIPFSSDNNRAHWKRDLRLAIVRNHETTTSATTASTSNETLRAFLASASTDPATLTQESSIAFLTHEIGSRLFSFMLLPEEDLDTAKPLSVIGVDSLVAIEIRNWWRQNLGFEVTVLEILNAGNLEYLGRLAAERLRVKFAGDSAEEVPVAEQA